MNECVTGILHTQLAFLRSIWKYECISNKSAQSYVTQPTQPHTYRLAIQLANRSEESDEVQSEVQAIQNYLALSSNLTKLPMLWKLKSLTGLH